MLAATISGTRANMKRPVISMPSIAAALALLVAPAAHASFLSGEALDKAADVLAIIVIVLVPIVGIVIFWLVHILPEKVAEQRHHPQMDSIKVICLLSLVFGGLLWPIAWIWAYTKPVLHKMAYGTDKHDDYYKELAEHDKRDATLLSADVTRLRMELDALAARGSLPAELTDMRDRLIELESRVVRPQPGEEVA
jgi:CBS domain containing-hemolysin-like protein